MIFVMLVELPDPVVILSVIVAFGVGLFGFFLYNKIRPLIRLQSNVLNKAQLERIEYYERQLIDMKIRLDAIELQGIEQKQEDPGAELKQLIKNLAKSQESQVTGHVTSKKVENEEFVPSFEHGNVADHVLRLITSKAMTSRDIQITLQRSREHTARLMKKLFEDGLVQRNTETKPYTYSITEKGKKKIGILKVSPTSV